MRALLSTGKSKIYFTWHYAFVKNSLDFDISLSNLYLYRTEQGNPTADTIDKIIDGIEKDCPEVIKKVPYPPEEDIAEEEGHGDL